MRRVLALVLLTACGGGAGAAGGARDAGPADADPADADVRPCLSEWPNELSAAASDPWIARCHDELQVMRPRFLAVSFANGVGAGGNDNTDDGPFTPAALEARARDFLEALRESSRYQPFRDPAAPPFLEPELVSIVDLRDDNGHANSDLFPRGAVDPATGMPSVGYYALFGPAYARYWGFREGGRDLTLAEITARGLVHEVLLIANQVDGRPPNPPDQVTNHILEVAFTAQAYDAARRPIAGEFVKNGIANQRQKLDMATATFADHNSMPWTGHSTRVYFLNAMRGAGCALHGLGHEMEFRYNEARIYHPGSPDHGRSPHPYLQPLFRRFADFDMRARQGAPFDSLYAGGDDYAYRDCDGAGVCDTLAYPKTGAFAAGTISPYRPACGNVHNPPGARHGYDYEPPDGVRSLCETFQQPGEAARPLDRSRWQYLVEDPRVDGDCGGTFLVYWYQNMPGFRNAALDMEGMPMKNWWAFMYY